MPACPGPSPKAPTEPRYGCWEDPLVSPREVWDSPVLSQLWALHSAAHHKPFTINSVPLILDIPGKDNNQSSTSLCFEGCVKVCTAASPKLQEPWSHWHHPFYKYLWTDSLTLFYERRGMESSIMFHFSDEFGSTNKWFWWEEMAIFQCCHYSSLSFKLIDTPTLNIKSTDHILIRVLSWGRIDENIKTLVSIRTHQILLAQFSNSILPSPKLSVCSQQGPMLWNLRINVNSSCLD